VPIASIVGVIAMLKYLRIAVTALSLTACVLMIALWVRSLHTRDLASLGNMTASSMGGRLVFYTLPNGTGPWRLEDHPRYAAVADAVPGVPITFGRVPAGPYITAHYWFLVFACGATAILLQWRYPYRFRLRTLLFATTLVAVGMGVIVAAG
jgi:hypothetical protein